MLTYFMYIVFLCIVCVSLLVIVYFLSSYNSISLFNCHVCLSIFHAFYLNVIFSFFCLSVIVCLSICLFCILFLNCSFWHCLIPSSAAVWKRLATKNSHFCLNVFFWQKKKKIKKRRKIKRRIFKRNKFHENRLSSGLEWKEN